MQVKIRVPRSLLLCIAHNREGIEEAIAEKLPQEFAIVKEIRNKIAEGKTVVALVPHSEGEVNFCYAVWSAQDEPLWRVEVLTRPNYIKFSYDVKVCRFFYRDEKDRLKEIKGKVA